MATHVWLTKKITKNQLETFTRVFKEAVEGFQLKPELAKILTVHYMERNRQTSIYSSRGFIMSMIDSKHKYLYGINAGKYEHFANRVILELTKTDVLDWRPTVSIPEDHYT